MLAGSRILVDLADITSSVFVETFGAISFAPHDKLKFIFQSRKHGGRPVRDVICRKDECFEIIFKEEWGFKLDFRDGGIKAVKVRYAPLNLTKCIHAVLDICKHEWIANNQKLSVTPCFQCFEETFKEQQQRLQDLEQRNGQKRSNKSAAEESPGLMKKSLTSSIAAPWNLTKKSLISMNDEERDEPKEKRSGTQSSKKCDAMKFQHPVIVMLLSFLRFTDAVQNYFPETKVLIDEKFEEVTSIGPEEVVMALKELLQDLDKRTFQKLHEEMDDRIVQLKCIEDFLAIQSVQEDLKNFLSARYRVTVTGEDRKLCIYVTEGSQSKIKFQEFVASLVIIKRCSPLPDESVKENHAWKTMVDHFHKSCSYRKLFINEKQVTLAYLAHQSEDIDLMVMMINNTVTAASANITTTRSNGTHTDSSATDPEAKVEGSGKRPAQISWVENSSGRLTAQTRSDSKETSLLFKNSLSVWILHVLKLKEAVEQTFSNVTIKIKDEDASVDVIGPKEDVNILKDLLMREIYKIFFTDEEEEFLFRKNVREYLEKLWAESQIHIVLVDLEFFVADQHERKEPFGSFLSRLIERRECFTLPRWLQHTQDWMETVTMVQDKHKFHCVVVTDDTLFLLRLGGRDDDRETNTIVKELRRLDSGLA